MDQPAPPRLRPLVRAGWLFVGLGAVELIAGLLLNPTLLLIAIHDTIGDGLYYLGYDRIDRALERSRSHFFNCILRKLQNLAAAPIVFGWALLAFFLEPPGVISATACVVTVVFAAINFCCNRLGHHWIHQAGDVHHHSVKLDLLGDMLAAPIAAVCSVLAFVLGSGAWNKGGGIAILTLIGLMMLIAVAKGLWLLVKHKQGHSPDTPSPHSHKHHH